MSKILLVEEYEAICQVLTDEFGDLGHDVWTASPQLNMLDLIRTVEPDLVILGVDYQPKDWGDILFDIKRYYYNLPIILFSSWQKCKSHPAALAADYVVIKSSDFDDLSDKVSRALQTQHNPWPAHGHPAHYPTDPLVHRAH